MIKSQCPFMYNIQTIYMTTYISIKIRYGYSIPRIICTKSHSLNVGTALHSGDCAPRSFRTLFQVHSKDSSEITPSTRGPSFEITLITLPGWVGYLTSLVSQLSVGCYPTHVLVD